MGRAHRVAGLLDDALFRSCGGCLKAEGVFRKLLAVGTDLNGIHSPGETVAMFGSFDKGLRQEDPYNDETWHSGDNWQTPVTYGLRGVEVGQLGDYPWKVFKGGTGLDGVGNVVVFSFLLFFGAWAASHIAKHGSVAVGHVATGVEHAARGKKAWRSAS